MDRAASEHGGALDAVNTLILAIPGTAIGIAYLRAFHFELPGFDRGLTSFWIIMPLVLAVQGTNFQLQVWQALLAMGADSPTSYTALAQALRRVGSERAVGNAVGANPVAWLIPCHNVLRKDGALGGYHWGEDRKRAMLAWMSSKSASGRTPAFVTITAASENTSTMLA